MPFCRAILDFVALFKKWMLSLLLLCGCADNNSPATDANVPTKDAGRLVDAKTPDAGSCQLSGGCDWVVSAESECPDVLNSNFCDGICGGGECCWCEGTEAQTLFIDCFDGCPDAGP